MLYVFAGFPATGLNATGILTAMDYEDIGEVIQDESVQYRKDGVYVGVDTDREYTDVTKHAMSDMCVRDGITWDWFPDHFTFGNGITIHKTMAAPELKTVVHGTDLSLEEFLELNGTTKFSELELERLHIKHEGWEEYEARWLPGTCPQVSHIVILTWVVTPYTLPEHAYQRLRALIEDGAEVRDRHLYHQEPDKIRHYFEPYKWDGQFAVHK